MWNGWRVMMGNQLRCQMGKETSLKNGIKIEVFDQRQSLYVKFGFLYLQRKYEQKMVIYQPLGHHIVIIQNTFHSLMINAISFQFKQKYLHLIYYVYYKLLYFLHHYS